MSILDILRQYGLATRQEINFAKSSVPFGYNIPEVAWVVLKWNLGICKDGGMGSNLGLP